MSPNETSKQDGALNSPNTGNTGNGDAVLVANAGLPTAVVLPKLPRKPKPDTAPTKQLDAEQELSIFQASIPRLIRSGIPVRVAGFYDTGTEGVVVILEGCSLVTDENGQKWIKIK